MLLDINMPGTSGSEMPRLHTVDSLFPRSAHQRLYTEAIHAQRLYTWAWLGAGAGTSRKPGEPGWAARGGYLRTVEDRGGRATVCAAGEIIADVRPRATGTAHRTRLRPS